jgi:hypothetical protein
MPNVRVNPIQSINVRINQRNQPVVSTTSTFNGQVDVQEKVDLALSQANSALILANTAYYLANTATQDISYIKGVDAWQNTQISYVNVFAQSAYNQANASYNFANTIYTDLSVIDGGFFY